MRSFDGPLQTLAVIAAVVLTELLYTGITNVELRARVVLNRGDEGSEYGERAVRSRAELRARLYF